MDAVYDYSSIQAPALTSYAQEGEDIILCKLFALGCNRVKRNGFYVDVGAHHPVRFSNTYLLYRLFGWTGVNIDPNPGVKALFDTQRPRDTNLEMGVSSVRGEQEFHLFEDPALNTVDAAYTELVKSWNTQRYLGSRKIQTDTLANVFDRYAQGRSVDLLNVDTEGHDLEVLKSGDWERRRPHAVLVECLEQDIDDLSSSPMHQFMRGVGYSLYAKTVSTFIYRDGKWPGWRDVSSCREECAVAGGGGGKPTLSVVFATMNRLEYLRRTVESLRRELDGKHSYEIVVVDGRSVDGSVEYLKSVDTVRLLEEDTPRGCCFAYDLGLRAARGEWVCWLNDDIEVTPGAFDKMFAFMTDPANAGVGMGAFPNSRSGDTLEEFVIRGFGDYPVVYADFGFLRRSLLEDLGFLDLGFRKYGWDPDLAMRIWEKGLRVAPCEGANIVHFFAEDEVRKAGDAHQAADCRLLQSKWEDKRLTGQFFKVFADADYREQAMRLLTGWPRLNLKLHYGRLDGLAGEAGALYRESPAVAAPRYYQFGLELMKRRCFDEARTVFEELVRSVEQNDPMLAWYRYKCGESLLRTGRADEARGWFRQAAAAGHVMSRLRMVDEGVPLRVYLGAGSEEEAGRIRIPLNIQDPYEWDYYFAARPMDDGLLDLVGNEFGLDSRILARMLAKHLSARGRMAVRPWGGNAPARRQAELLAEELAELGLAVTRGRGGDFVAARSPAPGPLK